MSDTFPERQFMPTFFAQIVEHGAVLSDTWPHHITLFAPISAEYSVSTRARLREIAKRAMPLTVTTTETARFGTPQRPVSVRLVDRTPEMLDLHSSIAGVLAELPHDPTYMNPYNPHVSAAGGELLDKGVELYIGGFSIAQKIGRNGLWQVVDKIRLKNEGMPS